MPSQAAACDSDKLKTLPEVTVDSDFYQCLDAKTSVKRNEKSALKEAVSKVLKLLTKLKQRAMKN